MNNYSVFRFIQLRAMDQYGRGLSRTNRMCQAWAVMANQADPHALRNLIEQAHLAIGSDPIPPGGVDSARENLKAALALSKLLEDTNRQLIRD